MSTVEDAQATSASRLDAVRSFVGQHLRVLSIAVFALGFAGLLISELGDVHQLRVFAAGLISLGGVGIGIDTGLADPRTLRVPDWMRSRAAVIGVVSTVAAIAPAVVALVAMVGGINGADGLDRSDVAIALGLLIGFLMLIATLMTGGLTVLRIVRAAGESPADGREHAPNGEGADA